MEEMGTRSGNLWGLLVDEMGMPNVKKGTFNGRDGDSQWKSMGTSSGRKPRLLPGKLEIYFGVGVVAAVVYVMLNVLV
jgi:hypothetical protein